MAAGAVLAALCAVAGWLDVRHRKLPNWLSLLAAVTGLGATFLLSQSDAAISNHLIHVLIALACGMGLFAMGVIGGGDAKFYAGIAAWFPLAQGGRLVLTVALTGFFLILVWLVLRRIAGIPVRRRAERDSDRFPYGIAIGIGAVITYVIATPGA